MQWPWGKKLASAVNLLESNRAIASHDIKLNGDVWRATGLDPFIVYRLDPRGFRGPMLVELEIEAIEGRVYPRIYLQTSKGFNQNTSELMRRTGAGYYKIHLYAWQSCRALRFDPAEMSCAFRIRRFTLRPVPLATFMARALRDGANRGDAKPEARRLLVAMQRAAKNGVSFETVSGGQKQRSSAARYLEWISTFDYAEPVKPSVRARLSQLSSLPKISVLMPVYNTPKALLEAAIESVENQIYENWELCIADDHSTATWVKPVLDKWQARDSRIKVVYRESNGHIAEATNSAFAIARGEYIALLDHDDVLRPHALAEATIALAEHPGSQLVYSDEDKIDEAGRRYDPYFKPDWNPILFRSQNYLNHLTVHSAANIRKVGGWRKEYNGSQDYDINLRIVALLKDTQIVHIPKILYHWRATADSVALNAVQKSYAVVNAEKALAEHMRQTKIAGVIEMVPQTTWHRIKYALPKRPPLVSIIIPTRNGCKILKTCLDSIAEKTTYPKYEIIIVDNNSDDPETLAYLDELQNSKKAMVLRYPHPFNYSAINNFGVSRAKGQVVALLNNDIEVITPDWLTEMVSLALQPGIGCVGAKLYYPNNTIQHAGVVLGIGGVAGHSHKYFDRNANGYFGRLRLAHNVSAATAACLVVRKKIYKEVKGLDEVNLAVAFNDVDFCLRVRQRGYANVWTPFAELYHHESVTRGAEDDPEKQARFNREIKYMTDKWGADLIRDRYYSPHLTLRHEDFTINVD